MDRVNDGGSIDKGPLANVLSSHLKEYYEQGKEKDVEKDVDDEGKNPVRLQEEQAGDKYKSRE